MRALSLALLLAGQAFAATTPLRIYVMAGQSNMVGGMPTADLPPSLQGPQPEIPYHYSLRVDLGMLLEATDWTALQSLQPINPFATFASELSLGQELTRRSGDAVAIIKVGANATTLAEHWLPTLENGLYPWMLQRVGIALEQLPAEYEPQFAGFIWVQGEGDAGWSFWAQQYGANLDLLFDSVREDFGVPDLPILFTQSHVDLYRVANAELRAQQAAAVAGMTNVTMINIDDQALGGDFTHYTAATQVELGRRFADAMLPTGDFDHDGTIDDLDLEVWRDSFDASLDGDGNADGLSEGADFLQWQRQLGSGPLSVTATVPEPASLLCGFIAGATMAIVARRRASKLRHASSYDPKA